MSRSSLAARLQDNRPANGPPSKGVRPLVQTSAIQSPHGGKGSDPRPLGAPGFENAGEFADAWLEPVPLDDQGHPYGKRDGTED